MYLSSLLLTTLPAHPHPVPPTADIWSAQWSLNTPCSFTPHIFIHTFASTPGTFLHGCLTNKNPDRTLRRWVSVTSFFLYVHKLPKFCISSFPGLYSTGYIPIVLITCIIIILFILMFHFQEYGFLNNSDLLQSPSYPLSVPSTNSIRYQTCWTTQCMNESNVKSHTAFSWPGN